MFRKSARAVIVGALDSGHHLRAQVAGNQSVYSDGIPKRIDLQEALNFVADVYDISKNPSEYIFVVARAVTAELNSDTPLPNENGDAFPLDELLRFDHRLARRVYKTFDFKPNHINHRAENPRTARGFILDSTFNALDPNDQFVECLISIDATKDPVYAEGIRTGTIDSFSMGCVAEHTTCSICANKATNRWQFCDHIARHKMKNFDGKIAYERCGGVCFEELSAVDQPADPKALAQEILSVQAQLQRRTDLSAESEILTLKTRLAKLEHALAHQGKETMVPTPKTAQAAPAPMPPAPAPAPMVAKEEEDEMMPFAGDMPLAVDDEMPPAAGAAPMPGGEQALSNYKDRKEDEENAPISDDEMGVMSVAAQNLSKRFAKKYVSIRVEATRAGNFRVYDSKSGKGVFAVRPPARLANRKQAVQFCDVIIRHIAHYGMDEAMKIFNGIPFPKRSQVLDHADDNLTDERKKQEEPLANADDNLTDPTPKPSYESTDERESNMEDDVSAGPGSVIDDRETNTEDVSTVSPDSLSSTSDPDSNKREEYDEKKIKDMDLLDEEVHNHEERLAKLTAFYQRKLAASEKAFAEKTSALEARAEKLAEQKARGMMARFERCLHLASERQRLNREESPLKISMADALLKPFDINDQERFAGCETDLTAMLVERGMQDGMPQHTASIILRAKELYSLDDRVLADSERDLKKSIAAPVVAHHAARAQRSERAAAIESRAIEGNPVFRTASVAQGDDEDPKRMAIRASVGRPGFVRAHEAARELGHIKPTTR
jgi:hypothetical protein